MKYNVSIIGAGSWGSAQSRILADNGHNVLLFDVDLDTVLEINTKHTNISKLNDAKIPESVKATSSIEEAINFSDIIVLVVPTAVMRKCLISISEVIKSPKLFVNASKGIEPNTFKRVSEIVYEEIDIKYIKGFVALTGPSHAEEVILKLPTAICAASESLENAQLIQKIYSNNSYFRVYTLLDLIGAELGGSLKNIIAIASGMITGLGYGDNAKAALITRGLTEMIKISTALGAKKETLYGLSGLGDLFVTTMSEHSRNFQAGKKIAQGKNLKQSLSEMTMVVEGARSAMAAYQLVKEKNIDAPIIEAIYDVLYNFKDPKIAMSDLMNRKLKAE
ncbi:MAG: NAD(P)H-dependent glycerol-3-phosphate dehydrogenase [Bacilli bacterium]|jgi:glycerol-3-phosphate dehydrogenase (NAD(P)+)